LQVIFSWESHLKLVPCLQVNLPKGYGYVEFKARVDAEEAQVYMDGVGFSTMLESNY
jgi:RNA recognition motif-containing protein